MREITVVARCVDAKTKSDDNAAIAIARGAIFAIAAAAHKSVVAIAATTATRLANEV